MGCRPPEVNVVDVGGTPLPAVFRSRLAEVHSAAEVPRQLPPGTQRAATIEVPAQVKDVAGVAGRTDCRDVLVGRGT